MLITTSVRILFVVGLMVLQASAFQIGRGSSYNDDYAVLYETRVEPGGPDARVKDLAAGWTMTGNTFHRWLHDRDRDVLFGYDVTVSGGGDGYLNVLFGPLSKKPTPMLGPLPAGEVGSPSFPEPLRIKIGDQLALDVMVSPETGHKVVDYITFTLGKSSRQVASGSARDFSVEDIALRLVRPKISLNSETARLPRPTAGGQIAAPVVWIAVPGRGKFTLSLLPRAGFSRAGEFRGRSLVFDWAGERYGIVSRDTIAPGSGVYHLYVQHEANYRSRDVEMGVAPGGR